LAIALRDLRFGYRASRDVLQVEHLDIGIGERVFLHGPSGSGKTTLLGLIAGVLVPTAGNIRVLDHDLATLRPAARDRHRGVHIGYLFQLFNLIPWLSVSDNIALPCRLHAARRQRLGPVSIEAAVTHLAEQLELTPFLGEPVTHLSVGQQQRVAAARALIGAPSLVIADEPTSALDADLRDRFVQLLFDQCRASGTTLLFVSHDLALGGRFERVLSLPDINHATAA
jgi:putative ABC transport system ATP-binding protein